MLEKIKLTSYILSNEMSEDSKINLLNRYEKMFEVIASKDMEYIHRNIDSYKVLMNRLVFITAMSILDKDTEKILKYPNTTKLIDLCDKGNRLAAYKEVYKTAANVIIKECKLNGLETGIESQRLENALKMFDLQVADVVEEEETAVTIDKDTLQTINNALFNEEESEESLLDTDLEALMNEAENEDIADEEVTAEEYNDYVNSTDDEVEESYDNIDIEGLTQETDEEEYEDELLAGDDLPDETEYYNTDLEEALKKEEDYEIQKAKEEEENAKALEKGKVSGAAQKLEDENTEANEEALQGLINSTIKEIMSTYSKLYAPLFLNPPKGLFFTDEHGNKNLLAIGNEETGTGVKVHSLNRYMFMTGPMYQAILEGTGGEIKEAPKVGDDGMSIDANWMNPDGSMKYNYVPHIQVRNCSGVFRDEEGRLKRAKTWSEFSPKLEKTLKPTVTALFNRVQSSKDSKVNNANYTRASKSIKELYTTVFMLNEFDSEKAFRMTCYNTKLLMSGLIHKVVDMIIAADPLNIQTNYKVMNNDNVAGVQQSLVVTDMKRYKGELNFAYKTLSKILETGGKINLQNVVVGTNLKGDPLTINLDASNLISLGIIAGSGSGKGVLTLSLMASMIAAGSPVVYLDYKPDMAGMLWDLERKVPGSRILAIDGQMGKTEFSEPVRAYTAGFGAPAKVFEEVGSNLKVLPYVKGVQLMNLVAKARVMGKITKGTKMFFILDEAQVCNVAIDNARTSIDTMVKATKPKGKDTPSEEHEYLLRLQKLFNINECVQAFLNTNGRVGNTTCVVLGQQADASNWKMPLGLLVKQCTSKFLGKGTKGGSVYGLSDKTQGAELLGMGYFGYAESNRPDESNTTMLKTTMVLNDADFNVSSRKGGPFTGSLLKNIEDPELLNYVIDNDMTVSEDNEAAQSMGLQVGQANTLVGFPGLVEYMASKDSSFNMAERLSSGYNLCEKVLNLLGLVGEGCPYENIEAYLHSGKSDSLFTDQELSSALDCGKTIFEYKETGLDVNEDGRLDTESSLIDMTAGDSVNEQQMFNEQQAVTNQINTNNEIQQTTNVQQTTLQFMTPNQLVRANFDDDTLRKYVSTHLYPRINHEKVSNLDYRVRENVAGGLRTISILAGTMHYAGGRRVFDVNQFVLEAQDYIMSSRDPKHAYKVILGFINEYNAGTLNYDVALSEKSINEIISQYTQGQPMSQPMQGQPYQQQPMVEYEQTYQQPMSQPQFGDNIEFGTNETAQFGNADEAGAMMMNGQVPVSNSQSVPMDMMPAQSIMNEDINGNVNITGTRNTTPMYSKSNDIYTEVPYTEYNWLQRRRKKKFESKNSIAYEFRLRWDFVLKQLENQYPDLSKVHTLSLTDGMIRVNKSNNYPGRELGIPGALGGNYNIQLEDIVMFKDTFKKVKLLKRLIIPSTMLANLIREYGENSMYNMFKQHSSLIRVEVVEGNEIKAHDRNTLEQQKEQMKQAEEVTRAKMAIEATCASKNPRLGNKSPGYVSKVFDFGHKTTGSVTNGCWESTKNLMNNAKKNLVAKDPKVVKALGFSMIASVTLGLTAVFGVPHMIGSGIKGVANRFK